MPARLIQVTIINNSDYPVVWVDDGREHGFWQEPWYPSNIKNLKKGEQSSFRLESGGIATGVKGWALFKVDVPFASNVGVRNEFFRLNFERAYIETVSFKGGEDGGIQYWRQDPRTNDAPHPGPSLAYIRDVGSSDLANMDSSPIEFIAALPGAPLNAPIFLGNESFAKHVAWVVEVRNTEGSSTLPLKIAPKNVIYGVTPRVEATLLSSEMSASATGGHISNHIMPASGGDLLWFRHDGRPDGSFNWEGPRRVGIRWDSFKHIFSGSEGIVYGIQTNGDLMWYRHVGRSDGSFIWEGPNKVGIGWGEFTQVFSGGKGIIYTVTPRVEASVHVTGGSTRTSGGDLLWFRHLGREDGSFNWVGPRKVGIGWDGLNHLFSDGDGIIYGVTPKVEASFLATVVSVSALELGHHIAGGYTPSSGGELMWYHHTGREEGTFNWEGPKKVGTGWGEFKQLFSGGVLSD